MAHYTIKKKDGSKVDVEALSLKHAKEIQKKRYAGGKVIHDGTESEKPSSEEE